MSEPAQETPRKFDLREAFLAKQNLLEAALALPYGFTDHGTTIGDNAEANWVAMLREFLPQRYGVAKAFVIDGLGGQSDQIDVVIYDRQYAPLFFQAPDGTLFVPAESVYAAFEVKPEIDKALSDYAADKVASVRRLHRTSVAIRHAGGWYAARDPKEFRILGGLLAARSGWARIDGEAASRNLRALTGERRLDFGCALDSMSFEIGDDGEISYSPAGTQLIFFAMQVFRRLQAMGTALAIDLDLYETALGSGDEGAVRVDGGQRP